MLLFVCCEAVESILVKLETSRTYSDTSPNIECSLGFRLSFKNALPVLNGYSWEVLQLMSRNHKQICYNFLSAYFCQPCTFV